MKRKEKFIVRHFGIRRMGISYDDRKVHGIDWILFQFDHIWVFVLGTPWSSDDPVLLLNQPNFWLQPTLHCVSRWLME